MYLKSQNCFSTTLLRQLFKLNGVTIYSQEDTNKYEEDCYLFIYLFVYLFVYSFIYFLILISFSGCHT